VNVKVCKVLEIKVHNKLNYCLRNVHNASLWSLLDAHEQHQI